MLKRTLVARSGNRFKLDRALRENLWLKGEPTAATLFPLISGENIAGVVIEDLALDGNRANNENLDGNYAGCIFLQDCKDVTIRKVIAREEQRRRHQLAGLPRRAWSRIATATTMPGLGCTPARARSGRSSAHNRVERNDIGIFFCWGVRFGLAENNTIDEARNRGHLDRPPRHRQPDPRQFDQQERQGRHPVPRRVRRLRPAPQPLRAQPDHRQRPE